MHGYRRITLYAHDSCACSPVVVSLALRSGLYGWLPVDLHLRSLTCKMKTLPAGIYTAVPTFFLDNEDIDVETFRRHLQCKPVQQRRDQRST